ncbi:MAG: DUF502 domain-containing protein [Chlamydiia bacterium]|nr:DUF502 domain-containing protein [Chlamydiia bacterium]MCP5508814.1 DUF502 domain-containing protein [Chlamydiales bacterium]HPE85133.1 DUF502 domain-containing protein [Chlamydiales bacterium]
MKKYFITGLVILLPVALTIAIIAFVVNLLTKPFVGAVEAFLSKFQIINKGFLFLSPEQVLHYGAQLLILIGIFFAMVLIGIVARWFFLKSLIHYSDKILHKIPIVNKIYKTTQEIIKTLFASDKNSFRQVVMVPFPHSSSWAIGLVSRESPKICEDGIGEEMLSILVPTTPNPTTGFLLMYKKSDLIFLNMKPEDAIKYIVSCGVIIPEQLEVSG